MTDGYFDNCVKLKYIFIIKVHFLETNTQIPLRIIKCRYSGILNALAKQTSFLS